MNKKQKEKLVSDWRNIQDTGSEAVKKQPKKTLSLQS